MTEPRVLPTGTVTFLFSDIEGSTRLVQEVGPAVYTAILERHNAILRAAFGRHGGVERGTQGDSFLVMFHEAPAALAAVAEAQVALAAEPWPHGAAVKVRMGLHSGVGRAGGDDYVGLDVNPVSPRPDGATPRSVQGPHLSCISLELNVGRSSSCLR